ncbi:hypothetical protein HMPREF9615_01087 [Cutibacterium acnes HL002PA3]|nr:hypothetical protein HMPREF9615_01087 [Cutibacterium acnes HL002PA3]
MITLTLRCGIFPPGFGRTLTLPGMVAACGQRHDRSRSPGC